MWSNTTLSFWTVLSLFWVLPAHAYWERPFEWSSAFDSDFSSAFNSPDISTANLLSPLVPEELIQTALDDRDHRIHPQFKIPTELKPTVEFWLKIYTQFTTQHVVLFDEKHPEIIYDVLDFRSLADNSRNRVVYEILRDRKIRAAMAKFRFAFQKLSKLPRSGTLNAEERKILSAIRRSKHRHPISTLAHSFRAQTGQRDNIVRGLGKADPLFDKMESIFASIGVPPELTRLVLVESSFNSNAVSRVGATGVWQFMERSAKEFLIVDQKLKLDERLSPIKSTVAAARLLQRNYRILKDWGLTIISYNSGVKPVLHASRVFEKKELTSHVYSYCTGSRSLGFAGKSYFPSFLALLHAESYRELFYGRPNLNSTPTVAFVGVKEPQSAFQFAFSEGVSLHDFIQMNPDIRDFNRQLPVGFQLAIPSRDHNSFENLISGSLSSLQLARRRVPRHRERTTLITSGDTRIRSDQKI